MPRDGTATREKILDAAEACMLSRGFAGTSVDDILEAAGISRGTFFYHFATKDEMARTLVRRYAEEDAKLAEEFMAKAEGLSRDPVQQVLIFMGLYIQMFEHLGENPPGCLFATYSYEAGLFDDETHQIIDTAFRHWRECLGSKLDEAIAARPPRMPVDSADLADFAYGIFEGAMIMGRVLKENQTMVRALKNYRSYLELLFDVVPAGVAPSAVFEGSGA